MKMLTKTPARRAVKRRKINFTALILAVFIIIAAALNIAFYRLAVENGSVAFKEAYNTSKDEQTPLTYEQFYLAAMEQYKKEYDLKTEITADYGNGKIEVMKFYDTLVIPQSASEDEESSISLNIPFSGVYTADLQSAEFITDQQRKTVKVYIPRPELTDLSIDYENAKLLDSSGIIVSSGKMTTAELARGEIEERSIDLREKTGSNAVLSENTAETAKKKIIATIMAMNPYEHIDVEVEFIN